MSKGQLSMMYLLLPDVWRNILWKVYLSLKGWVYGFINYSCVKMFLLEYSTAFCNILATVMLHESSDENRQPWLCLDIDVSWNYSFEWVIFILLLSQKLWWIPTKQIRTNRVSIGTKPYFILKNKNWNCLWMSLILRHISTQTFCVWFIDWRVNEARRQKRKDQCPKQSGMHWTNERFF